MAAGRRPPTAPTATGAKAPSAPAVRPKKLYRADAKNRDDKPAIRVLSAKATANKQQDEGVLRGDKPAKSLPIAQLSRKELQVIINP